MKPQFMVFRVLTSLLLISTITACSSNSATRSDLPTISVAQAKASPAKLQGTKVFWGGTIINVKNFKDYTQIEVLKRPLSGAEPNDQKKAQGRFMAKISGFIDPIEYKTPSRVTITGILSGVQKGKVGSYPYTYPLIKAEKIQFWQGKKAKPIRDPYWWDHPYYRPFPYHHRRGHW